MIRLDNISKQNGHQILFIEASMGVQKGEKVGLVGPNGAGKTTLFRMITGQEPPDDGLVAIDTGMTIGYFSQDVGEMSGQSAVAAVMDGVGPVSALAAEMARLEAAMVDPDQADQLDAVIERYGVDALRYYLLRDVRFGSDGGISYDAVHERYHAELANDLGNLVNRVTAMIEKYRAGVVPPAAAASLDAEDGADLAAAQSALDGSRGYLLHEALDAIARTTTRANLFIQTSQPWALAKDPAKSAELDVVLAALVRSLARQAVALAAYMPNKAEALWTQLGGPGTAGAMPYAQLAALQATGWQVKKGDGLFPRPAEPASI